MGMVIDKTVKVLRLVSDHEPCTLKQLTLATRMKKPTLYLILKSMVENGLLEKRDDGTYRLGPELFALTRRRTEQERFHEIIRRSIMEMSSVINESVTAAIIEEGKYRKLFSFTSRHPVAVAPSLLRKPRFYGTATGRILLAFAISPDRLDAFLDELSLPINAEWPEVDSRETLWRELDAIRKAGHSQKITEDGQVVYLAAPVFGSTPDNVVAIGVSVPTYRFCDKHREEVETRLAETARILSTPSSDN